MLLSIQDLQGRASAWASAAPCSCAEAVKGVSASTSPRTRTVALVGESGSGKSVTAMSILNLLPDNAERQGRILWQGRDLLQATLPELQALRGKEIACVFQDPMTLAEPGVHGRRSSWPSRWSSTWAWPRARRWQRAEALLAEVGIPEPKRRLDSLPARDVGRPAAARDDRDGAGLRAQAADRRRADDRAGRDDPAPDPRADRAS